LYHIHPTFSQIYFKGNGKLERRLSVWGINLFNIPIEKLFMITRINVANYRH
jgi:hypothetical protein